MGSYTYIICYIKTCDNAVTKENLKIPVEFFGDFLCYCHSVGSKQIIKSILFKKIKFTKQIKTPEKVFHRPPKTIEKQNVKNLNVLQVPQQQLMGLTGYGHSYSNDPSYGHTYSSDPSGRYGPIVTNLNQVCYKFREEAPELIEELDDMVVVVLIFLQDLTSSSLLYIFRVLT